LEALRLLLAHDRRLIERFRAEAAHLEQAQVETERMTRVRDRASAQLAELTRQLARERAAKRALLTEAREDRSRERAALYELEAAARTLEETLTRLGDAPEPRRVSGAASTFESLRGRLEPPVKARVAGSFGRVVDSEFRTETFRKGVDFAAEEGAEVRAVADGAVRFAGWFRGYGKLVILDHGDRYFSVSGHLGEIAVERGDRVEAGDRIGSVGETGSLSGPRLYFEIRRGGAPLDPDEWLSNREPR
jgi:septal ring factor EnvC (AmiA/AmiB activator)